MTTTVETLGSLERKLTLNLSVERVNTEVAQRLKKIAKTVRMPGFRPGKVPMKYIVQNYNQQVNSEVVNEQLNQRLNEVINESQLRVASTMRVEPSEQNLEGELLFSAIVEVFPEVKLGDLAELELEKVACEIGDNEIDSTITILRKQRQTFIDIGDRPAQQDDRLTVDFFGKIDDVAFDGGTSTDFVFVLGGKQMLPAFEEAAFGMSLQETKTFDLSFPENYHGKEVAGKTAQFTLTIKKIEAPVLPDLTDDFAKLLGVEAGTIDALREDVRVNLSREIKNRLLNRNKEIVMDGLIKLSDFELPKSLVQTECEHLIERVRQEYKDRGMSNLDSMNLPADLFKDQAQRRVRLALIVSDLVKTENLKAKQEQIRLYIEDISKSYEDPSEVLDYYLADSSKIAEVDAIVVEQNVVDWVLSKAKVTVKNLTFEEIMGNN